MADIISIEKRRTSSHDQKANLVKRRKILAVQKVFQCTHCAYKCEKCGTQIRTDQSPVSRAPRKPNLPYRFCESCHAEYLDYIERLKGKGDPDCYWHNAEWLKAWRAWIDYQSTVDAYLKSKEFTRLVDEMKPSKPDE